MDPLPAVSSGHTEQEWALAYMRADGRCAYCKKKVPAASAKAFKVPISRGGTDSADNLEVVCRTHQRAKGEMTPAEFRDTFKRTYRTPGKTRPRAKGSGTIYRRDSDGMYCVQVELPPGPNGERRKSPVRYAKDPEKADRLLEQMLADRELYGGPLQRMRVREWVARYIDEIAALEVGPRHVQNLHAVLHQQIDPCIGDEWLDELGTGSVRRMLSYVRKAMRVVKITDVDGSVTEVEVPKWSSRTVKSAYDLLHAAVKAGRNEEPPLLRVNVVERVKPPKVRHIESGSHTAAEARVVLAHALEHHDPDVMRWFARLLTAMRQGELLGLEWDRVDLENNTIDTSWQLQMLPLKRGMAMSDREDRFKLAEGSTYEIRGLRYAAALVRPKGGRSRLTPIPPIFGLMLKLYRENCRPNKYGLVWVTPDGEPIDPVDDRKAWRDAQAAAGVEVLNGHATRHTTNTLLASLGVDEPTRMAILGQSSYVANRMYLHHNIERLRPGLAGLARMLLPENIVPPEMLLPDAA